MMDEQLNELMRLAGVQLDNSDARGWLERALQNTKPVPAVEARGWLKTDETPDPAVVQAPAATPGPVVVARAPKPSERNAPLDELKKRADALLEQFHTLRKDHPHAHSAFWHADYDEPEKIGAFRVPIFAAEDNDEPAEIGVIRVVEKIIAAAAEARIERNGRPPKNREQQAVNVARWFFKRYSPEKMTGTPTGKFARFAQEFYVAVYGHGAEASDLERQIRSAAKSAKSGQKPPVLS